MVKNLFEKTVIEALQSLNKGQGESKAFHESLRNDIDEIKKNVDALCKRTTTLETQRDDKIKAHGNYIKIIGVFSGVLGSVATFISSLPYLRAAFHG